MIRDEVVKEAMTWLRTPYHPMARIKGVGVDCGQILIEVYSSVGLIKNFDTGAYPMDWALHRSEERYLGFIQEYAHRVDKPQKGDVVLYRFGRCVSHGGIIIDDEGNMVHAKAGAGVIISHYEEGELKNRLFGFYEVDGIDGR